MAGGRGGLVQSIGSAVGGRGGGGHGGTALENNNAGELRGPRRWEMGRGKGRLLGARAAALDAQDSTRGGRTARERPAEKHGGRGHEDGEAVGKLPDAVVGAAMPSGSPRLKQRRAGGS